MTGQVLWVSVWSRLLPLTGRHGHLITCPFAVTQGRFPNESGSCVLDTHTHSMQLGLSTSNPSLDNPSRTRQTLSRLVDRLRRCSVSHRRAWQSSPFSQAKRASSLKSTSLVFGETRPFGVSGEGKRVLSFHHRALSGQAPTVST